MRKMAKALMAGAAIFLFLVSMGCEIRTTEYDLTVSVNGSGRVSPSSGTYDEDTRVTLTATAASGWVFTGWSGDASGTNSTIYVVMNSDKHITANFSQASVDQYKLTVYTSGSGSVNTSGGTYDAGTTVSLTATAASGWEFSGWSGDVGGSSNSIQVTMNSNKTVTATFVESSDPVVTNVVFNGKYTMLAAHSGKAIDTWAWGTTDGTNIAQYNHWGGEAQQYKITPVDGIWHRITPVIATGQAFNVADCSSSAGANIQTWSWLNNYCQMFRFQSEGDGTYRIINRNSSMCLDVADASTDDGANVIQNTCTSGSANQLFEMVELATNNDDDPVDEGITAAQAVSEMGIGWNLGNSLDALGNETSWGNPTITQSLLNTVSSSGFGVVRIPVTWIGHFGSAPNYTIDAAWLNRVEEVVNYVLNAGMYAIINIHHDGAEGMDGEWLCLDVPGTTGTVTSSNNAAVKAQFVKMWEQIADHFKGYGQKLIFESMNEIHVGYDAPKSSYNTIINDLNQVFVDTVRASGGNNGERILVVPGYNTNVTYSVEGFSKPSDSASGKLILSCHFYDPWTYAIQGSTLVWGAAYSGNDGWGQEDWVHEAFDMLKNTFINQGLPVILGESGAVNPTNSNYADFRRYYIEYVYKAAHDRGIVPIYWDNGAMSSGSESFGLINRSGNYVQYPAILNAMMRAVNSSYSINDIATP